MYREAAAAESPAPAKGRLGFRDTMRAAKEERTEKQSVKLENRATKQRTKLQDSLVGMNQYVTSVTTKVVMGTSVGKDVADVISEISEVGFRLQLMTTVYAEKVGINTLIHTLVFERRA